MNQISMLYWKIKKSRLNKAAVVFSGLIFLFPFVVVQGVEPSLFPANPKRIVTLVPSLGELAADLLGEKSGWIVGVSEYTDYPPGLKKLPSIGPYSHFNLEKVLSLHPDLVLASEDGNLKDQVLHLRELHIPVLMVKSENFDEVKNSIQIVANALGRSKQGKQKVAQLELGLQRFREKAKNHPVVQVMLQVGDDPLVVVGSKSFLHESLKVLGASNVYGGTSDHYPHPALEDVFHRDPDIIVVMALGEDQAPYQAMAKKWMRLNRLRAVQKQQVYVLKSDELLRPTLRILEGLSLLEKTIYGKK